MAGISRTKTAENVGAIPTETGLNSGNQAWLRGSLLFVRGFHHPARRYCPAHAHADCELVFHPRGKGVSRIEGGDELRFAPGDAVFYPAGCFHDQRIERHDDDCCLHLALNHSAAPLDEAFVLPTGDDPSLRDELIALARCGRREERDDAWVLDLRVEAVLARLLHRSSANQAQGASDRLADRAAALIAEQAGEVRDVASLAETLGVSADHLRHAFTHRHGISPVRKLIEARITRAKDLLAHAPLSIRAVGEACGFSTPHAFAAAFRREVGTNPRAWREQYR
jgi:AraC-like DNA-binding protein